MSLLPTAHAGQSYGSRRIDFFTVSGQVSSSDASTGRVTDPDGLEHDVKLIEQSNAFAPGDSATIVRVQSGPNRRSRPVAIVNHSRGVWMRAAPDATAILARSGVTRSFNWWLSIMAMVLTATVAIWPTLHVFLTEVNAGMMAGIPAFSVYDEILARVPGLADWRLETALPTGIADAIAGLGFIAMDQLTALSVFAVSALLAILAFSSRSWRLLYIPAFAAFSLIAGAMFGAAETSLIILAGGLALYLAGGLVNRIRDSGRLNARVERLAEHVMRNPPQEEVRSADMPATAAVATAAAATVLATQDAPAAAETAIVETDALEASDPAETMVEEATAPASTETAASEAAEALEAETESALPAVEASEDVADAPVEDVSAATVEIVVETPSDAVTAEAENLLSEDAESTAAPEVSDTETLEAAAEDAGQAAEPAEDDAPVVGEAVTQETEDTIEDDLPSMEAVAEAAALNASEQDDLGSDDSAEIDLEDESTMPVPPPPPMPAAVEAQAERTMEDVEAAPAETPAEPAAEDDVPETSMTDAVHAQLEQVEEATDAVDAQLQDILAAADAIDAPDATPAAEAATVEDAPAPDMPAPVDDPVMDDGNDPMTENAMESDFAPGAPEVEVEPRPAE